MRAVKSGACFSCLSVFLLVQIMAAVPALHLWAHQDASDPSHECAVTLCLHGQVHAPTTEVEAARFQPVLVSLPRPPHVDFVSADIYLLPSRGPPRWLFV